MKNIVNIFNNLTNVQKVLVTAIIGVVLYLVSAGVSYSLFVPKVPGTAEFKGEGAGEVPGVATLYEEDPSIPRTEPCPLNGGLKTKQAKDAWSNRRPLAIMVENHQESRPQSGLSQADVVYEAVAEGGITRFMAVFYCNFFDVQVGPVRSARTYFLDWASEYDPLYAHVGGANTPGPANALGQIVQYKIKSLNQFGIGFPTFWRDYQRLGRPVATEHTMYSSTQKLWDYAAKRGWSATDSAGVRWDRSFKPWGSEEAKPGAGSVSKINVTFWENQDGYKVEWLYGKDCNCYKRKNGGAEHVDLLTNKQITPVNVVVRFVKESRANDGYENNAHLLYGTIGKGKAVVFRNGEAVEGTWNKPTRISRETFLDKNGKEIPLSPGQVWLEAVPEGSSLTY